MAGGSPFEINDIFGLKVQRYKVAMYVMGIYGGIFFAVSQYNKWKPQAAVKFDSKEQENYANAYVKHAEHESHKPELLRTKFSPNH